MTLTEILSRIDQFSGTDIEMTYSDPTIGIKKPELSARKVNGQVKISFRLPARLNSPLMDTGKVVPKYMNDGFPEIYTGLEQNTLNYLHRIGTIVKELNSTFHITSPKYFASMETFLHTMDRVGATITLTKGSELESLNMISKVYSDELISLDLKQATMRPNLIAEHQHDHIPMPTMLTLIMRVRAAMTRGFDKATTGQYQYDDSALSTQLIMSKHGWATVANMGMKKNWILFLADRWAGVYNEITNIWVIVPMTYMDYYYTKVEIIYNMKIVSSTPDYSDIRPLINLLESLASMGDKHDTVVDFMKSFEGLVNMSADFKADSRCSVGSMIDVYESMEKLDKNITGISIPIGEYFKLLIPSSEHPLLPQTRKNDYSVLYKLGCSLQNLSPIRMLEVSSLHKFCFYSVIDEELGIKKFAKRTHTAREIDSSAIRTMRCYFNREYVIEFTRRHKRLPQVLSDPAMLKKSDIVEELGITDPLSINEKYKTLIIEYKKFGRLSKDTYPLDWWYDIRPYDCEEDLTVGTPIEHAKDKRSAKATGTYTAYDTEKELERIIRSESIQFRPLTKIIKNVVVPPNVCIIQQGTRTYNDELTTIMKEKEREQKREGRLFGMLTTEGKQSLSKMMTKAEHVLSYFKGNLMTPSDSERKKTLHWMAQSLLDDDKYAIMADIEGHNQSMQFANTADLLESIGLIYGEQEWYKLSRIFSNLNLFYAYAFEDYSFLSTGQLGGIEGWMNPVWTLHTVIVTSLLPELTGVDIRSKAIYSDDIAVITALPELTEQTLNAVLKTTQDHFYRYGMILKSLQTVVSKFRVTMLRQHYMAGVRADASLKRMISASTMGNQFFHCDEIESSGLVSSISSALELSNSIYPQIVLKWVRLTQLLIRPFLSAILTEISPEIMNEELFSQGTVSIYRSLFPYSHAENQTWVFSRLKEELSSIDPSHAKEWVQLQKQSLSIKSLSDSQRESAKFQMIRLMREDKSFIPLFVMRCLLPVDMGGVNAMLLEQMILTGFRDSLSRTLSIIKGLYADGTKESKIVNQCLMNVLGGNGKSVEKSKLADLNEDDLKLDLDDDSGETYLIKYDDAALVTQEWPTSLRQITPESMIKGKLLALFKKICVNKELKDLLSFDDYRQSFKTKVVDELKGNFYSKIARFYLDTSGFMIVDKILSKVENTSSLIRRVNKFERLCKNLAECAIKGPRKWLLRPIYNYGIIDMNTNIQEYLFFRRNQMFPSINFVSCIEPEANSIIKPCVFDGNNNLLTPWSLQCSSTSGMSTIDGKTRYLPPMYGNEALYKGSIKDENEVFVTLKEALLVKCVSVTKWIIYRSDERNYFVNVITSTNISNCADLTLSTLGYGRFRLYQPNVPLLTRSEIAHRIPVLDQKPKAVLRCLPSQTTKFKVTFNQSWVYAHNLADSDLHFDYFKMRLICAEAVSMALHEPINWSRHYYIQLNPLIRDVQFNYLVIRPELELLGTKSISRAIKEPVPSSKINWLSSAIPAIIDGQHVTSMPKIPLNDDHTLVENNLSRQLIIEYYKSLKTQNLWDFNPLWSDSAWQPFINKYKEVLNAELELTPENIRTIIHEHTLATVQRLRSDSAPSNINQINKVIIKRISDELLSDDDEIISTCDNIIEIMATLSKNSKDKRNVIHDAQEILDMYSEQHNKLIKEIFYRIVIENCLVIITTRGELQVDIFSSEAICEEMLQDLVQFVGINSNRSLLAMLITKNLKKEELRRACVSIIEHAANIVNAHDLELEIEEESIVKVKYEIVQQINPDIVNVPNIIPCKFYSIIPEKVHKIRNITTMLEYRSKYIQSRGNPEVYESPLCSDIYATAYNLLRGLQQVKVISHETIVLDLTAGRGEFNIALNKLGIQHISLNRRDQYCAIKCSSDVKYIDEYDWASNQPPDEYYSELSLLTNCETIALFDISHLGQQLNSFVDRLIDIMDNHETLIVRTKPIAAHFDILSEKAVELGMTSYIAVIGEDARLSPYTYLIITRTKSTNIRLSDVDESTKLARRVVHDVKSVFKYSEIRPSSVILSSCSLYEDFDLFDLSDNRIKELISVAINRGDSKVKHELLANLYSVTHYYIPDMVIKHADDELKVKLAQISNGSITNIRELKDYGYKQFHMSQKTWDKVRAQGSGLSIPIYKLTLNELGWIRSVHPIQSLRKIAHLLFRSSICELMVDEQSFEDMLKRSVDSDIMKLAHWGPRSRNFYDSILLLIGNSMHNSPNMHLQILKINYQLNLLTRRNYFELLKYCNILSALQNRFDNFLNNWVNESELGRFAMEEFYDRYVRRLNYFKDYKLSFKDDHDSQMKSSESTNHKDELLAKMFLESIDKIGDIDLLSSSIISDSNTSFYDNNNIITEEQVNSIMNAGIIGVMGDTLSEIKINEEVLKEDELRLENMRKTVARSTNETDDQYESRLKMMSLLASMNDADDEYYDEYDD